ncbi:O-antigen polymerase [Clostridium sp. AWRP]|uniref:O-antigen polymerase n=1 Tax=Clostridium sp. AWRP TaxID=2212991 RepID=UPI000FDB1487|nr:O-antigen polymerase [Clostridium sp. AWRP]AZV58176.1 oligosaccharide repeat unit polymerase [Clostridium sp. AWRP]
MIHKIYNMINKDSKILSIILYLFIIAALTFGYIHSIEYYKSFNFIINQGILKRSLIMLPLFVVIIYTAVFLLPHRIEELTSLYWLLFLILSTTPLLIVYIMSGLGDSKNSPVFIYTIAAVGLIGVLLTSKFDFKIPQINISPKTFWIGLIAFMVVGYGYIIYKLGMPTKIIQAFKDVYSVRLDYRDHAGRFVDYFVQWLGNIINPFILAFLIYKRKYKLVFIPFVLQIILYGYAAYKSQFAVLLLAPFFGMILRYGIKRSFIEKIMALAVALGIAALYLKKLSIYLLIIIRVFLWPSLIALEYFDFFSMYPKMKLAQSILGHFFKNIYNMDPNFYMATVYYGRPDMRLNVTWYGDAYMNFGIIGIVLFAILLYFIMIIIRSVESKNILLVSTLLFGGIMALFNGPILTTLLTNGLGLGVLLAYLLPKEI